MESRQRQAYKTISSQDDTRHGTTVKKRKKQVKIINPNQNYQRQQQQQHKSQKNSQNNLIMDKINDLKLKKQWYIQNRKYRSASLAQKQLKRAIGSVKLQYAKKLSLDHYRQKQQIKIAHKRQLKHFKKVWFGVFQYDKQKQRSQLEKFKRQQQRQLEIIRINLRRKYYSMKINNKSLIDLKKQQQQLIKLGRFQDLYYLKQQRKKIKINMEQKRRQQFEKMVGRQQQMFKTYQTKRYNSLMIRLEDSKHDAKRKYYRQHMRLKQKYKNVLQQLNHQQTLQINQLLNKDFIL